MLPSPQCERELVALESLASAGEGTVCGNCGRRGLVEAELGGNAGREDRASAQYARSSTVSTAFSRQAGNGVPQRNKGGEPEG